MLYAKSKFGTDPMQVIYSSDEIEYIESVYKNIRSLPKEIQEDLYLWLSHICEKYSIEYKKVFNLNKYQVWLLLLSARVTPTIRLQHISISVFAFLFVSVEW